MPSTQKIGFLVHSRDIKDLIRRFFILKFLPESVVNFIALHLPPITVSNITGLKNLDSSNIKGYIIGITMTAHQMIENRELALKKIIKACQYAEKKGVTLIGLGALTSSFSRGGLDILPHVKKLKITTGRAYTTKTVTDYVKHCIDRFNYDKSKVKLAIVGAGGSVGSSCAKLLALWGVKNILLVDVQKRAENLKRSLVHLLSENKDLNVEISHSISQIKGSDIIITATNAPEAVLSSDDLSPGSIVVNDAQPSDVPDQVILERSDILVIEGGIIHTPGIKCNFNLGLAHREDTFCCLGEVLILARREHSDHYALGELDHNLVSQIEEMSHDLGFGISRLQNSIQKYIPDDQIANVKSIIQKKNLIG
ncbi:MAG: hypothetical protein WCO16_03425 [bacterium]